MSRLHLPFLFLVSLFVFLLLGCQSNPTIPSASPEGSVCDKPIQSSSHQCLGYYMLMIDTDTLKVDPIPVRTVEWHFNLTGILNTTMGVSAAGVPSEHDPPNGLFVFDITLTHPFDTSPQLAGFDVKGILMTPGIYAVGSLIFSGADETRLENADGYSRWWNPTEFSSPGMLGYDDGILASAPGSLLTATVNPYKLFADILYPTSSLASVAYEPLDSDQGRAVFTAGSSNTRRYEIRFPMDPGPQIVYGYAIDCAWNPPSPNPPDEVPDDFPMNANQPEAYRIGLRTTANTLYYDSESGVGGGVLRLEAGIFDWQGQAAGNIVPEIDAVRIIAPDLIPSGVDGILHEQTAGKAVYTVDLTGTAIPSEAGGTLIVCRVGSSDGSTYQQTAMPAPDAQLSAFQVLALDIPNPDCEGDANNDWTEAFDINFGDLVTDQVCLPDDYRDYYIFEIPPGHVATGTIHLWCDAEPTKLGVYDFSEDLVAEADISGGHASLSIDDLDLMPGEYYIRVYTSNDIQVAPYLLEMTGELIDMTPSDVVDVTPGDLWVMPDYIWLHDDYAYLIGEGYWVYDMTDPANPVFVTGELFNNFPIGYSVCFEYPYCYIEKQFYGGPPWSELWLIDFSNPMSPVVHENVLQTTNDITAMCMNSEHLYVATGDPASKMINIYDYASDPHNPTEVGSHVLGEIALALDLIDPEGPETILVIGISYSLGLLLVEDPSSITSMGIKALPADYILQDLAVWNNFIFVVDRKDPHAGWLDIYELTDTPEIVKRDSVHLTGDAEYIEVNGQYAYIGDGPEGLSVCDISDPTDAFLASNQPLISDGRRLALADDCLCIIPRYSAMQVFNLDDPAIPTPINRPVVTNYPQWNIFFENDYMIVPDQSPPYSINVYDISDPANAHIIAENQVPFWPDSIDKYGDLIACGGFTKIVLVDASDPLDMHVYPAIYDTSGGIMNGFAFFENAVYWTGIGGGVVYVYVVDVSNPLEPSDISTFSYSSYYNPQFIFHENYMYLTSDDGVRIYSVVNELFPSYVGTYTTIDRPCEIEIINGLLYIYMAEIGTVEIADLSSPASPVQIGTGTNDLLESWHMAIDGQFAYFSGNDPHIYACWIYPPDDIHPYGDVYPDPWAGRGLYAYQGHLYKNTLGVGLRIFDLY